MQKTEYDEVRMSSMLRVGNEMAFESIYDHYKVKLYYFAYRYLGKKEEAEEIVQNTFILLWEHRSTIDPRLSLKSYLYKTTTNLLFNYLKRKVIHQKYVNYSTINASESENCTQKELYFDDLQSNISKLIEHLPKQQQAIFKLSRWEGLSNEEIASKLSLSIRTVENQIYRTIRYLKLNMKNELFVFFLLWINLS